MKRRIIASLTLAAYQSMAFAGALQLTDVPLPVARAGDPNVVLSLSIEAPVEGAAYNATQYDPGTKYLGYFDPEKCYRYHDHHDEDHRYFHPIGPSAANGSCEHAFSGRLLNWATMSSIDIFRHALTGGDRVVDTPADTVLGRMNLAEVTTRNHCYNSPHFAVGEHARYLRFYGFTNRTPECSIIQSPEVWTDKNVARVKVDSVTPFRVPSVEVHNVGKYVSFHEPQPLEPRADRYKAGPVLAHHGVNSFRVAVKVCEDPASLEANCSKYVDSGGRASYKPEGQIQRNASKMRFSVTSYLNERDGRLRDGTSTRPGGYLRALMKYVGGQKFDPSSGWTDNERREWNQHGVILPHPDHSNLSRYSTAGGAVDRSGVVNYLNQFGGNGTIKAFDPVAELYYETLRYLKGQMSATPEYVNWKAITETETERFPVYTTWDDPLQSACQPNYVVQVSDVNTNFDTMVPRSGGHSAAGRGPLSNGRFPSGSQDSVDAARWTNLIKPGLADRRAGSVGNENGFFVDDRDWYQSGYYFAGLAYYANAADIRPDDLDTRQNSRGRQQVKTFVFDVNEPGTRGDHEYTHVGPSNLWLAAKFGGFKFDPKASGIPFPSEPGSWTDGQGNVEYPGWRLAAERYVGENPRNYVLASSPKAMVDGFQKIFESIQSESRPSGSVAMNEKRLSISSTVYLGTYDASNWSGDIAAHRLDSNGGLINPPLWNASEKLAHRAPGSRRIFTSRNARDDDGAPQRPVEFQYRHLDQQQKERLNQVPGGSVSDGLAEKRVAYLRGNTEEERPRGPFRSRGARRLGAIAETAPVLMTPPSAPLIDPGYAEFRAANASRPNMLFAGSSDGMLHAFDPANGEELFAYVPSPAIRNLGWLTSPDYNHRFMVTGTPAIADVAIGQQWRTILVGSMGLGGQGLYALRPSPDFGASDVLWEFTDRDDPDLGYSLGTPTIAKVRLNDRDVWAAIFSSGANATVAERGEVACEAAGTPAGCTTSSTGKPALFVALIEAGHGGRWQLGATYFKLQVSEGSIDSPNALFEPSVLVDGLGNAKYAYAGDVRGNLWKFDLTAMKVAFANQPLFVAERAGARQPITTQPQIVVNPKGGHVVLVGTGKFIERNDQMAPYTRTESFYGVWDRPVAVDAAHEILGRGNLVEQVVNSVFSGQNSSLTTTFRNVTTRTVSYDSTDQYGWFIDLPDAGERSVTNASVANGRVFFATLVPSDGCDWKDDGWLMNLEALSGAQPAGPVFDTDGSGWVESSDTAAGGMRLLTTEAPVRIRRGPCTGDGCSETSTSAAPGGCPQGFAVANKGGSAICLAPANPRRVNWRELSSPR